MRTQRAKLDDWLFGHDHDPSAGETADEPFDSFGPISAIRGALDRPSHQHVARGPHDFTRILVAEADPYHRRVLRVLLASQRISSTEVEDGQSAIDLLALRSFDLVLLDMDLPLMNGAEVIRWVRRSSTPWSDIPILGLLNEGRHHEAGKLISIGMTDWTSKPLSRHHLADKIVHLLPALYDAGL